MIVILCYKSIPFPMKNNYKAIPGFRTFKLISTQIIFIALLVTACSKDKNEVPAPENKFLVAAESLTTVPASEVKQRAGALLSFAVQRSVRVYRLTYRTTTPDNKAITASGLVLFPDNFPDSLTLLSFQHGTITTQDESPSMYKPAGNMEAYLGGTIGASLAKGYFVVMPDYLGFGESKTIQHPYQHRASLASASLDMLRAAKEFAASESIKVKKGIRLAGYSEGGYATMALHLLLEQTASSEFTVAASYPGAGTYDMLSTAQWVVSQNKEIPASAASYYMWTLLTYNQLYNINEPLTSMLTATNAAKVSAAVAAGNPLSAQVDLNPSLLFTPGFIAAVKTGSNTKLTSALKENNVYDWKPKAPVTLFHAPGDDIVPFLNAEIALATLKSNGADVKLLPLGTTATTHTAGAQLYLATMIALLLN
jgi:pimeloyl-ACP methyl ester carboxylesterase